VRRLRTWLDRPQKTNRDAIVVGVLGGVLTAAVLYGAGGLLSLAAVVDFSGTAPVWLVAVVAGLALALGLLAGRAVSGVTELEAQVGAL
jgi:ammonia channel protein AmtB